MPLRLKDVIAGVSEAISSFIINVKGEALRRPRFYSFRDYDTQTKRRKRTRSTKLMTKEVIEIVCKNAGERKNNL
jgi:hypothetical protein